MATWIELRCENRGQAAAEVVDHCYVGCWSDRNEGPQQMASDTRKSVLLTLRDMEREAKATGWKRTKEGWICPYCAKTPNVKCGLLMTDCFPS